MGIAALNDIYYQTVKYTINRSATGSVYKISESLLYFFTFTSFQLPPESHVHRSKVLTSSFASRCVLFAWLTIPFWTTLRQRNPQATHGRCPQTWYFSFIWNLSKPMYLKSSPTFEFWHQANSAGSIAGNTSRQSLDNDRTKVHCIGFGTPQILFQFPSPFCHQTFKRQACCYLVWDDAAQSYRSHWCRSWPPPWHDGEAKPAVRPFCSSRGVCCTRRRSSWSRRCIWQVTQTFKDRGLGFCQLFSYFFFFPTLNLINFTHSSRNTPVVLVRLHSLLVPWSSIPHSTATVLLPRSITKLPLTSIYRPCMVTYYPRNTRSAIAN